MEKPLATNLADAKEMIAAAASAGKTLMVSQNYRFRPPARAAQATIRSGELGELVAIRSVFRRDTRRLFPPGDLPVAYARNASTAGRDEVPEDGDEVVFLPPIGGG